MKTLILGGVRSGKSRLAERVATATKLPITYIATAGVGDEEMRARVAAHRARRPATWTLVEEPIKLSATLYSHAAPGRCLLVDCLTLWLTNLLSVQDAAVLESEHTALLTALQDLPGQLILVSNEASMGVIPLGELTRRYCDEAGRLHQDLARLCERVILTIAGLPHVLKGEPV